jgi:hypothetical protein
MDREFATLNALRIPPVGFRAGNIERIPLHCGRVKRAVAHDLSDNYGAPVRDQSIGHVHRLNLRRGQ